MPPKTAYHPVPSTRWSLVQRANGSLDEESRLALSILCDSYWYPLYAYVRRLGHRREDAEDLTQGFFARLLEKGTLAGADPQKGKLRTFLLTCLNNYLHNEHERAMAAKRGAGTITSFNATWAEERYAFEPVDDLTPDRLYQRRWALTIVEYSLQVLGEEYQADGKGAMFDALRPHLGFGPPADQGYEDIAVRLGIPAGTLKSHVSRLRGRWREILFEQVSLTLEDPSSEAIKDELSELIGCV